MINEIKSYVSSRFVQINAPRSKSVTLLKKEIVRRLTAVTKYYVNHGLSPNDAFAAAQKTVKNIKAPIRAALSEERKKEASHARIKAAVSFLAMVCLIMSPFPIVTQFRFGFVFAMGLIAFGVVLFAYSSKSVPKEVDVERICDRFEIGMVKRTKRDPEPKTQRPIREKPVERPVKRRVEEEEDDDEAFEGDERKSVYSMTSKMFVFVFLGLYVVAGMLSSKWLICLMIFPICFSVTRLAKAFTDFFKGQPDEPEEPEGRRKGAHR
ncbi:MAG: hypothetical protein IJ462_02885 [Clostridia bacterium]|nr:hypothetical protein [Clostridia bacterium]